MQQQKIIDFKIQGDNIFALTQSGELFVSNRYDDKWVNIGAGIDDAKTPKEIRESKEVKQNAA